MMKKVHILFAFIFLFVLDSTMLNAQALPFAERKEIADEAIRILKDGTLIVRLKSKHNKLTALHDLLTKYDTRDSRYREIEAEIKQTIAERDQFNQSLVDAFEQGYTFSEVYYMYDTASTSLRSGTQEGIFLNKNLEPDSDISIPEGAFFVGKVGTTNSSSTTGVEAFVLMDQGLNDLERPFPYYVRVNSIRRVFLRIFNPKNLVRKDSKEIVQKLEQNLWKYWNKATSG